MQTRSKALIWIGLSAGIAAHAGFLPFDEAVQVMKEQQGADAEALARIFGASNPSALTFNTVVDSVNKTFGYSVASGTTYEGQPLTLSASGAFDTSSGQWHLSSNGNLGGQTFGTSGAGTMVGDPFYFGDWDLFLFETDPWVFPIDPPPPLLDYHSNVEYGITNSFLSTGQFTFTIHNVEIAHLNGLDHWNIDTKRWDWNLVPITGANFRVDSNGTQNGGIGNFSMRITAVPEPATVARLGFGLIALGVIRRMYPNRGRNTKI